MSFVGDLHSSVPFSSSVPGFVPSVESITGIVDEMFSTPDALWWGHSPVYLRSLVCSLGWLQQTNAFSFTKRYVGIHVVLAYAGGWNLTVPCSALDIHRESGKVMSDAPVVVSNLCLRA